MFTASAQLNVTLICGPTDMRKAIDGDARTLTIPLNASFQSLINQ